MKTYKKPLTAILQLTTERLLIELSSNADGLNGFMEGDGGEPK